MKNLKQIPATHPESERSGAASDEQPFNNAKAGFLI